ncbi:MAG TPA: hypothetical protein VI977_04575 [archaeon]|nr:hypothetical protein [archaeon]
MAKQKVDGIIGLIISFILTGFPIALFIILSIVGLGAKGIAPTYTDYRGMVGFLILFMVVPILFSLIAFAHYKKSNTNGVLKTAILQLAYELFIFVISFGAL